jgi:hypothetical protein
MDDLLGPRAGAVGSISSEGFLDIIEDEQFDASSTMSWALSALKFVQFSNAMETPTSYSVLGSCGMVPFSRALLDSNN